MDTVHFRSEEKLVGTKHVVPADRNAGWGYLFLTPLFQIHHGDLTALLRKALQLPEEGSVPGFTCEELSYAKAHQQVILTVAPFKRPLR